MSIEYETKTQYNARQAHLASPEALTFHLLDNKYLFYVSYVLKSWDS